MNIRVWLRRFAQFSVAAICTFCITYVAITYVVPGKYINAALEGEAAQLLADIDDLVSVADVALTKAKDTIAHDCSLKSREAMSNLAFTMEGVREIAFAVDNNKYCSSRQENINIIVDHWEVLKPERALGIGFDKHLNDYGLLLKAGDLEYANAKNIFVAYLEQIKPPRGVCAKCIVSSIKLDNSKTMQVFGEMGGEKDYIAEFSIHSQKFPYTLSLKATNNYLNFINNELKSPILIVGSILGIIAGILTVLQLERNSTFKVVIENAIRAQEFVPFYQPIVNSRTGKVEGCEALVRWRKPNGEYIPPYQFIPFVEESGQVTPITIQLMEQVFKDIHDFGWNTSDRYVSINLVPDQLMSPDFVKTVHTMLDSAKLTPSCVAFEITERKKLESIREVRRNIASLLDRNISFKIDDAGTGYGGFSYVQDLGVDTLKIDKLFIDTINSPDDVKRPVLGAIINFALSLGMKTIAEGVETKAQVDYLYEHNVFSIQGYVYAKPMKSEDFKEWVTQFENTEGSKAA